MEVTGHDHHQPSEKLNMRDRPNLPQNYTIRYPDGETRQLYGTFRIFPGKNTTVVYPIIFDPDNQIRYLIDPRGIITIDSVAQPEPTLHSPRKLKRHQFTPEIIQWFDNHPEWPQPQA